MYNDYAINNELFNWESQSITSVESDTDKDILMIGVETIKFSCLFVSLRKNTALPPYIFLGNARYVSHKGSKPIQIVWKMDHRIPERIIRESKLRVVN